MTKLSRLVLVAAVAAGLSTAATPAQAHHNCGGQQCYECVTYPCYPEDWVEFLSGGTVTIRDHQVCVAGTVCT